MKLMRLAVVAAFALVGGIAIAEDLDVQALQARLAAQEARLNDLQAKVGGSTSAYGFAADQSCGPDAPEAILSLNKNATVKIGGEIGTRYYYKSADVKTSLFRLQDDGRGAIGVVRADDPSATWTLGDRQTVAKRRTGDFKTSDAFVSFTMDVNDNFDAFLRLNLLDAPGGGWDNIADKAWVRWKNICNSGFGVLVGKNDLVFGEGYSKGAITPWTGGGNGEIAGFGYGDTSQDFLAPALGQFIGYDHGRTVQLTPYWKSQDGKYSVEASFFQGIDWYNGGGSYATWSGGPAAMGTNDSYSIYRKSLNYGWGSASLRLRAQPIEGLNLSASVINAYSDAADRDNHVLIGGAPMWTAPNGNFWPGYGWAEKSSNTAIDLAFKWNPCFLPKFGVWGQWVHNWNAGWEDATADAINAGIWYDFTDRFTAFFQGDYYYRKNKWAENMWDENYKTYAWATYVGLQYKLPYGVTTEIGWRHDNIDYKNSFGDKHTVIRGDTIYGSLYFDF